MPHGNVLTIIEKYICSHDKGHISRFGFMLRPNGTAYPTADSEAHPRVALAIEFAVRNIWTATRAFQARVGWGLARLPSDPTADSSIVLWWLHDIADCAQAEIQGATAVSMRDIVGNHDWERYLSCRS